MPEPDGDFTLYEDENDSYNYEKGQYATSNPLNDATRVLTLGARKGSFPGNAREIAPSISSSSDHTMARELKARRTRSYRTVFR